MSSAEAQGVLLDEWRGFHPYTTWSTTTFANAETLLAEAGDEDPGPDWPGLVEDMLGAPVVLRSHGPTAADKRAVAPTQAIRW